MITRKGTNRIRPGGAAPTEERKGNRSMGRHAPSRIGDRNELPCEAYAWRGDSDRVLGCSVDRDGRVVVARGAWGPILGWQRAQLAGTPFTALIDPADRERVRDALTGAVEERPARRSLAARLRASSGDYRELHLDVTASKTNGPAHARGSDI